MSFLDYMLKNNNGSPFTIQNIFIYGPGYLDISSGDFCKVLGISKIIYERICNGRKRMEVRLLPNLCLMLRLHRETVEAIYLMELRIEIRRLFDLNDHRYTKNFEENILEMINLNNKKNKEREKANELN